MSARVFQWVGILVMGFSLGTAGQGFASGNPTNSHHVLSDGVPEDILDVFPEEIRLRGKDDRQQLVVTANERRQPTDATRNVQYASRNPQVATVSDTGVVRPAGSGTTHIVITRDSVVREIAVTVEDGDRYLPLDFTNDINPILTRRGCNGGGCHGKTTGRGGFRLSLFGFTPADDYEWITRNARGRRIFIASPEQSLLLRKPTMTVPHGGGRRLGFEEPEYERLRRWVAQSTPWGAPDAPRLARLEIFPEARSLRARQEQQLLVTAVYSDGSRRDVTRLARFSTNDSSIADVDEWGLVTAQDRTGETAVIALMQGLAAVSRITLPSPESGAPIELAEKNFIDRHVREKLETLNVAPSPPADDATFLRRASLQIIGRLPGVEEVRTFLQDPNPDKRDELIDALVDSSAYADQFAQKWSDVLRNKRRGQRARLPGTVAFHRWIRNALAANKPYDEFVREILTATGNVSVSPPAQWYAEVRYLDRYVDDTAQVFLGVRIGCARCHHHPFENFTQEDYYGLAAFFGRVDRKGGSGVAERRANETIFIKPTGQVKHPDTGEVIPPHGLGGPALDIPPYEDPREYLVDWMAAPENPYFARAFVNRMWAHFFGRGLVEPLDDMRVTNPAANEPLLDALADEFIQSDFDMKHIVRLIGKSATYQLSSEATSNNLDETQNHSRFYPQRLAAEVLLDAIDAATGSPTSYKGLPEGTRAVQLPDEDFSNEFLTLFGRPKRESACECERDPQPSLSQSLFVMNDQFVLGKVFAKQGRAAELAKDERPLAERVEELFLATLTRPPTADELSKAQEYLESESDAKTAWGNLLWALINTKEFLYNH